MRLFLLWWKGPCASSDGEPAAAPLGGTRKEEQSGDRQMHAEMMQLHPLSPVSRSVSVSEHRIRRHGVKLRLFPTTQQQRLRPTEGCADPAALGPASGDRQHARGAWPVPEPEE